MSLDIQSVGYSTPLQGSISSFLTTLSYNGNQRPNRYAIKISAPVGVSKYPYAETEYIASLVQIPARTINYFSDNVGPYSPYWDVPLKTEFDDHFIINFIVDKNWNIRKFIDEWMGWISSEQPDAIPSPKGTTIGTFDGKSAKSSNICESPQNTSTISILPIHTSTESVNKQNQQLILYQAWPKLILPSQFEASANNMLLNLSVDFSYRYYKWETI
jgi:hypothetical protein